MVLVFDETYLWQRYDVSRIDGEKWKVVGGTWPSHVAVDAEEHCPPEDNLAVMMLDFMLKRADFYDTVSICQLPVSKHGNTGLLIMTHVKVLLQASLC